MIVDDEPFNITAIMGMLKVLKFKQFDKVDICYNGEESLGLV